MDTIELDYTGLYSILMGIVDGYKWAGIKYLYLQSTVA